jgi:hypothetical protein
MAQISIHDTPEEVPKPRATSVAAGPNVLPEQAAPWRPVSSKGAVMPADLAPVIT